MNESLKADVIIVCGYDYSTTKDSLKEYLRKNVYSPYTFIKKYLHDNDSLLIYIDTEINSKKYTLSRYKFAKHLLAEKLSNKFINFYRIDLPIIVNNEGKPLIHGGTIVKFIYNILLKINFNKSINLNSISEIFFNIKNKHKPVNKKTKIKGVFIDLKRSIIVDRFLRFIYG